jgi:16S rRNA U516 pseudouridylate synthase RsuA-like enzyme
MARRTQITLTDGQYEQLKRESERTGASLAELVRRALAQAYGDSGADGRDRGLRASFGAWRDRDFDGAEYVERLRRGMARRLAR